MSEVSATLLQVILTPGPRPVFFSNIDSHSERRKYGKSCPDFSSFFPEVIHVFPLTFHWPKQVLCQAWYQLSGEVKCTHKRGSVDL